MKLVIAAGSLLIAALGQAATISGMVVDETGEPLPGVTVHLIQVSLDNCCRDEMQTSAVGGSFRFDAPSAVYVVRADGKTPYYPRLIRVDARQSDQNGLRLLLTRDPQRYVADDPPRASRIAISMPNGAGEATLRGSDGAVAPHSWMIMVNTETGDTAFTEAGPDGSFAATLFAPAGTSVLVTSGPYGDTLRLVVSQMTGFRIPPFGAPRVSGMSFSARSVQWHRSWQRISMSRCRPQKEGVCRLGERVDLRRSRLMRRSANDDARRASGRRR